MTAPVTTSAVAMTSGHSELPEVYDEAAEAASDALMAAAAAGWALGLEPAIVRQVLEEVI
jgi:hypothetical protein